MKQPVASPAPGTTVGWGVLGGGRIAVDFIADLPASTTGRLVAVGSRTQERAQELARSACPEVRFGSYDDVIRDDEVDAVYIATPHPSHLKLIVQAAAAGKHILCEKPLTMNADEARAAAAAVREAGVLLMEAFMYRVQEQTAALVSVLSSGTIGVPRQVESSCSFFGPFDADDRVFNPDLGGGAILDVGCYPVSMVRMIAGVLAGDAAVQPSWLIGNGHRGVTGVEEWAVASLGFESGLSAHVRAGVRLQDDGTLKIFGDDGYVAVPSPWAPGRDGGPGRFTISRVGHEAAEERTFAREPLFGRQVDAAAANFARGEVSTITVRDSIANMATLDRWRDAIA